MTGAFPEAEHRRRVLALQDEMAREGLGALLLTTGPDIFYVSGFLTRFWESPTRTWFVVVPAQGDPVAVIPEIGSVAMRATWIRDVRTWNAPDPIDDGLGLLADALRETGARRIGAPMGPETHLRAPLAEFDRLRGMIAPAAFADATMPLRRVREVKSEAEIARIRAACAAAGAAFARAQDYAGVGVPLDVAFRGFQRACLEAGADWVSYLAGGAGPGGYLDVISSATERPLEPGDVLMLDAGAVCGGYFCDFDRNFAIGEARDESRRAHAALVAAAEAGRAAARPGMTAEALHRVLADALRRAGADPLGGRLGHGLGLALTEWPSLMPGDATVLREGMALTLEPGVALPGGRIMVHEENVVLRADGAEALSTFAGPELPVLGMPR